MGERYRVPLLPMVDHLTPSKRSLCMSHIRGKDTLPEMTVRSILHELGYRFRLHRRDLPGTPDLVFPSRRKVIFVHGCYWHRHRCRRGRSMPTTNAAFWAEKFSKTLLTDRRNIAALKRKGWRVFILWECEVRPSSPWLQKVRDFFDI